MFSKVGIFAKDIGIDLGTANTLVYLKGSGIVLREPSVVVIDKFTGRPFAVGTEANEMIGRTPDNIVAVRPLQDGVIADFDITQTMLRTFIRRARGGGIFKPRVIICIPSGVTEVERRAVQEAAITAGAKNVVLMEEPMAAAIGAGLPIQDAGGCMIVDIGGGTTEIAVISLGGVVASRSVRIAGDALDSAIINYIKKEFSLNIGDKMAEEIKLSIGTAYEPTGTKTFEVRGRNVSTGLPASATVTDENICEAMSENINTIMDAIRYTLENTPPELASDIMERGMVLTGGGALLSGMDTLISETLRIPAHVAEYPLDCVAVGTGKSLNNIKKMLSGK